MLGKDKITIMTVSLLIGLFLGTTITSIINSPGEDLHVQEKSALWDEQVLNPEYLVENSDTVVVAEVEDLGSSQWSTKDGERPEELSESTIFHEVNLNSVRELKGDFEKKPIRIEGGKIDDVALQNEMAPEFFENETVLVMLEDEGTHYSVRAGPHGKFEYQDDGRLLRRDVPPDYRQHSIEEIEELTN